MSLYSNWQTWTLAAGLAIALISQPGPVSAQDDVREQGRALALKECARCHAIGESGDSTHREAPPFRKIGEKYPVENLEEALAEGIMVGHPDMPEFELSTDQITALLAHIEAVSR